MKFTVHRYLIVSTEIEADTPEQALDIEEIQEPDVLIGLDGALIQWEWSTNEAWVDDDSGETVLG